MTLLRAAARTMLASYFVASGVKALRDPAPLVPAAEPVAEKIVPLIKQVSPDQVSGFIPEDTATLVRVDGALQIVGGLALATGKGRRMGAWLLASSLPTLLTTGTLVALSFSRQSASGAATTVRSSAP